MQRSAGLSGLAVTIAAILLLPACYTRAEVLSPETTKAQRQGVFSNPVISGFAPDPSVVRVGKDFYLVNSTFEYFPGIPVYHSRDLVNWTLIGHALHDPGQADLATIESSGGVHASTIRYSSGTFYVITTNVKDGTPINFIVTATDPRGPWSEPHVLEDAPGIDPSLFFDDDGRVWYVGNRVPPDPEFPGQAEIWLQELDPAEMRLVGKRHYLWRGCCGGVWAEGPHIYRKDGYYYLLISEGGTAFEHALSVAISEAITGPYRNNPRNPVLTHRHLSYDHPVSGVGHADMVELEDGRWFALLLGWRLIDGEHGILGRETFLVPVTWETEPYRWKDEKLTFPVFSPETGRVELRFASPFPNTVQSPRTGFSDDFSGASLDPEWNMRRTHTEPFWHLGDTPGHLGLTLQASSIGERETYSFVGIRQRDFSFRATTKLVFTPASDEEEAGMTVIQNDKSALMFTRTQREGRQVIELYRLFQGQRETIATSDAVAGALHLRVEGDYLDYAFFISRDGLAWQPVARHVDGRSLSPAIIDGFNYTGVYLGLYASANGKTSRNKADFDYFEYRPTGADRDAWYRGQHSKAAHRPEPDN